MKQKSNADHLRELINSDSYSKEEALEFVTAMEDEVSDLNNQLKESDKEAEELQTEIDEMPETESEFLGLDTIHYRFEQGNLKIKLQFEHWVNLVKQQNGAGVMMPG